MANRLMANRLILLMLTVLLLVHGLSYANYAPTPMGPVNLTSRTNYTLEPIKSISKNPVGGTFSIVNLNATTQNYRWSGFVGNVTGYLGLGDSMNRSLFTWEINVTRGEIYASRSPRLDWSSLQCANDTDIFNEETDLNINTNSPDSINNTFSGKDHKSFISATKYFEEDECYSTSLNINGNPQNSSFNEVLLFGNFELVYVCIIENNEQGYDGSLYDFQLILPNDTTADADNSVYYFYVELA